MTHNPNWTTAADQAALRTSWGTWERELPVLANGNGAAKTTTVFPGLVVGESIGVGDELYFQLHIPPNIDRSVDAGIRVRCFTQGVEASKNVSFDIALCVVTNGGNISATTGTIQLVDQAIPATNLTDFAMDIVVPFATYLYAGVLELHFRVTRVAASLDPTAEVAVHSVIFSYGTV